MLITRSPVRISFGGGGTDLPAYYEQFGGVVLSTAINKYFYTVLRKRGDGKIQVISSDLRTLETWENIATMSFERSGLEIPLAVVKEMGHNVSVDLFLASEIPPGTGLGSSASVCVNVLKALSVYLHLPLSKYELAERAYHVARNVLGNPVGKQDEYAAVFGGLNYIRFGTDGTVDVDPVELDSALLGELEENLLLFFTGATHRSQTILEEQEKSTREDRGQALESLHFIAELADRMRSTLEDGDLHTFGTLLDEAWQAKKRISGRISSEQIDTLYRIAKENGAVGGKITGAGGGGFMLLYCEPPSQEAVRQALAAAGAREMTFRFDSKGTQVIVNDPFIDGDETAGGSWSFIPYAAVRRKSPAIAWEE
ncbi:MAG: GHMP kinase [Terriglobia bacterium]|jgi:D-glycero-alpha-D-manno-heptose-7-phosphate kinase